MSYSIGQYRKSSDGDYMAPITTGCSSIKASMGIGGYQNECFVYNGNFNKGTNYYLHCWVKNENYNQTIKVKLCKTSGTNIDSMPEDMQFVKYLKYTKTMQNGWRELTLIFNPVLDGYNSLIFELQNPQVNESVSIIYDDLCSINNQLQNTAIKLGVCSNPGAVFCINNEEIHLGKSGIFEIYDEDIQSTFCAPVTGLILSESGNASLNKAKSDEVSVSLISSLMGNERKYPFFTIDYIYEN